MKRFYKEVAVAPEGEGFAVLLDGKPVKTPGRATLFLPTRPLAEAVAEEWRAQGENIEPASMPLTKLAHTAIDIVTADRGKVANHILSFGRSDLLCYRAEAPAELAVRQRQNWDPLLEWLGEAHGARLRTGEGVGFIQQPGEALTALDEAVWAHDDFALAGLYAAATITGSLALALALAGHRLDAAGAFAASTLDEAWQAEKWGHDSEAIARRNRLSAELAAAERFLRLLGPAA